MESGDRTGRVEGVGQEIEGSGKGGVAGMACRGAARRGGIRQKGFGKETRREV